MADPLDIYDGSFAPEKVRGASQPVDQFEVIAASFRAARDEQPKLQRIRLDDAYQDMIEEIRTRRQLEPGEGGFARRFRTAISLAPNYDEFQRKYDGGAVWREIEADRMAAREAGNPDPWPDLPRSQREFELKVLRRDGGRDRDIGTVSRAEGLTGALSSFVGGVGGEMTDEVNLAFLPLGGFGKTAARRILSEAFIGAGVEGLQTPRRFDAVEQLGEEMTYSDAMQNILFAFAGGAAFQGIAELGVALGQRGMARLRRAEQRVQQEIAAAGPGEDPLAIAAETLVASDPDLAAELIQAQRGGDLTLEERGALIELQRTRELDEANPFAPIGAGRAQFEDDLTRQLDRILAAAEQVAVDPRRLALPETAPAAPPANAAVVAGRALPNFDMARYLGRNRSAESGGNDAAKAISSSAFGRYQFLRETWLEFYEKTFGKTGESRDAILAKRADGAVQDRVMQTFTAANLNQLERAGVGVTEGNAYLAHFLGVGDAIRVLRAASDTPIEQLVSKASRDANPKVFDKITSASELIAWAHRKMGGGAASVPAGGGRVGSQGMVDGGAVLREDVVELPRQSAEVDGLGLIEFDRFDPDDIGVDAGLMQFKAGGDEFGVTERLRDVKQWNPFFAGRVMVWEAEDGRRLIADGHQRLGLARRIKAQGDGQQPMLDAFVLRESDGWDAETVRTWAALKNIAEGTGSAVDAAKVLRGVPREVWQQFLPPRSALVRDAEGLVRLGDDAFGMVVNELLDPAHAAIVGRLIGDPGEQKALMDLLVRVAPRTQGEAEGVIRQGMAAGFTRETQEDMFGTLDITSSLFLERARVLDRGLAELRKMRQAFGSAARNADTLEAAGNRINRDASAREVEDNARAVEIVRRSAWSAGPVKDAIDAGAARLAAGERIADIVRDFVAAVRQLDLDDLARAAGPGESAGGRGGADGAGRGGEGAEADAALRPVDGDPPEPQLTREGDPIDPDDGAWPSRAEMEEAGQEAFDLGGEAPVQQFDEPGGKGQKVQIESLEHDMRATLADREQRAVDSAAERAKLIDEAPEALKLEVDDIRAVAQAKQDQLAAIGDELGSLGEFINPGIKGRDRMIEKVLREGYASAADLKDVVRGAFVVDSLEAGEALARSLGERFPGSRDKGWKRLQQSGYFDRKLLLDLGDRVQAELQLVPRQIWNAKKREGNRIYDAARSTNDIELQLQLNARSRELYDQALTGTEFAEIAFGSAPGKAAANADGSSVSPSNSALVNRAGVSRQEPSRNNQALPDERSMATGRSSTSNSSSDMDTPLLQNSRAALDLQAAVDDVAAGTMFEIDGQQRLLSDVLGEADADRRAIEAARACLL